MIDQTKKHDITNALVKIKGVFDLLMEGEEVEGISNQQLIDEAKQNLEYLNSVLFEFS